MLFDSSLRKELARSFGATLVVLVTVVITMMLIRTLGQASRGNVNPSDVVLIMGFTVLGQLPLILSLSLFIATVGTLSRMYRDSEMVIWFASGRGLAALVRPLLRFAWPVMGTITVLALWVWPWANQQIQSLKIQYQQRSDIDRIAPGQFQESANGMRVFFIDKDSPDDKSASNVFIAATDADKESVTSARSAQLQIQNGQRIALLTQGARTETTTGKPGFKVSEFAQYGTHIGQVTTNAEVSEMNTKAQSTHALWGSSDLKHQAELGWRVGLALASLNFVLLGLALASANPRVARSGNLVLALFAFIVYYNLMTLGQSWIATGRTTVLSSLLLHGGVLACALLVLAIRHNRWSLQQWRTRYSARGTA